MIPVNQENLVRSSAAAMPAPEAAPSTPGPAERQDEPLASDEKLETVQAAEAKGDPEMAPIFLRHLLPVFTHVFQGAMLQSVR